MQTLWTRTHKAMENQDLQLTGIQSQLITHSPTPDKGQGEHLNLFPPVVSLWQHLLSTTVCHAPETEHAWQCSDKSRCWFDAVIQHTDTMLWKCSAFSPWKNFFCQILPSFGDFLNGRCKSTRCSSCIDGISDVLMLWAATFISVLRGCKGRDRFVPITDLPKYLSLLKTV